MSMPAGRSGHFVGLEALIKSELTAAKGLADLTRSMREASDEVSRAAGQASAPSAAVAAAVAPTSKEAGKPAGGNELSGGITQAIRAAEAPLVAFGAHIDRIFDRVAGTVIEGFRRVDSNTKFPTFDGAITRVKHGLENMFREMAGLSRKTWDDVGGTTESLERSIKSLEQGLKSLGPAARMGPFEAALTAVSAAIAGIEASLKSVAEALKGLTPAVNPALAAVQDLLSSVKQVAAATPLLSKDFEGAPRKTPGLRDRQHPIIRLAGDAAAPDGPPAPPLGPWQKAAAAARDFGAGVKDFGSEAVTGLAPLVKGLSALTLKAGALGVNLARTKPVAFLALAGSVELAVKAVGLLGPAGAASGLSLAALGAGGAKAGLVLAGGMKVAGDAILAVSAAASVSPLGLLALGVAGVGATVGIVKLGQAFFRLNFFTSSLGDVAGKTFSQMFKGALNLVNPFKKTAAAVGGVESATRRAANSFVGLGKEIALALGAVGVVYKLTTGLKDFFLSGVTGASDLAEATSAVKVTFGKFNSVVSGQAKQMAKDYGLSQKSQLDVAAGFGEMAMGAGMAQDKAAGFANVFTKLAADLNSRKNFAGGFEEAAGKIQSALSGESKPLRELGVNIDEAAVKAKVMSMGLAGSTNAISDQAEMAARAALIQEGLASANGDLARTADSAANQFRKAGGGLSNFGISIGEVLLPAVTAGTMAFNDFLGTIIDVFEANKPLIESWANSAAAAMKLVAAGARNLGAVWTIVKDLAFQGAVDIVAVIGVIPDNFGIITKYVAENWRSLCKDLVGVMASAVGNLYDNLTRLGNAIAEFFSNPTKGFHFDWAKEWRPMLEGFEATSAKFPGLLKPQFAGMGDDAKKAIDKIMADFEAHNKPLAAEAEVARKPAAQLAAKAGKDKKGKDFADLAEVGSKEAYTAIIKHAAGAKDNDTKKIARNSDEQVRLQREANAVMRHMAGPPRFLVIP